MKRLQQKNLFYKSRRFAHCWIIDDSHLELLV
jgi:hypothetical protein